MCKVNNLYSMYHGSVIMNIEKMVEIGLLFEQYKELLTISGDWSNMEFVDRVKITIKDIEQSSNPEITGEGKVVAH